MAGGAGIRARECCEGTGLAHEAQLLTDLDGPAVAVENRRGASHFVLVCEHASNVIPGRLDGLGLEDRVLASHAAYDIGALAVARKMSGLLDATLVHQRFSRLVYDCNRPPEAPDAMAARSEIFDIPANAALSEEQRTARTNEIYRPFHDAVEAAVEERLGRGTAPVLVTIHSFTRIYNGRRREVDLGILDDLDTRLSEHLHLRLRIMGRLRRPAERTLRRRRRRDAHPQASRAAARIDECHVRDRQRSHRRMKPARKPGRAASRACCGRLQASGEKDGRCRNPAPSRRDAQRDGEGYMVPPPAQSPKSSGADGRGVSRRRGPPVDQQSEQRPRMPGNLTFEQLKKNVESGDIDTVLVCQVDMQGRLMGKRFHGRHFIDSAYEETHSCNYIVATDMEMETVPGYKSTSWAAGYGDYTMKPDMATLRRIPWLEATALVICDVHDHHTRRRSRTRRAAC